MSHPSAPTALAPLFDPATCALPGVEDFGGDTAAHRQWYRTNVTVLLMRDGMTAQRLGEAAGVSDVAVAKWFKQANGGLSPNAYRRTHGLKQHVTRPDPPSAEVLASLPRVHHDQRCWDAEVASVVVDLRKPEAVWSRPVAQVLDATPASTRQWHRQVGPSWLLHGYGLGSNIEYSDSVLTATRQDPAGGQEWRLVVVTDALSHGKFSMRWWRAEMPVIADALLMGGGSKAESEDRYAYAQDEGEYALDSIFEVVRDLDAWAGDLTVEVGGWDDTASDWTLSMRNLLLCLRWASYGVPSRDAVAVFQSQEWGTDRVRVLDQYLRGDKFRVMQAMLGALDGSRVGVTRVPALVDDVLGHVSGEEAVDWFDSPLGQWFFLSPAHASALMGRGWTRRGLLRLGHQVSQNPDAVFPIEVLLWERNVAGLPSEWCADVIPVGLWVEAGVTRRAVGPMLVAAQAETGDAREAALRVRSALELLAGLWSLDETEAAQAVREMSVTVADRVPRGYRGLGF